MELYEALNLMLESDLDAEQRMLPSLKLLNCRGTLCTILNGPSSVGDHFRMLKMDC
ncbi:hypothetical protein Hanom_Chr05g00404701 [Helianthus anomalus]